MGQVAQDIIQYFRDRDIDIQSASPAQQQALFHHHADGLLRCAPRDNALGDAYLEILTQYELIEAMSDERRQLWQAIRTMKGDDK